MVELTPAEKREVIESFRRQERENRNRIRPEYKTISVAEAEREGYKPVTSTYRIRQFDQCAMLDRVIADFKGCDIKLVRVGVRKNMIEVWRR